MRCSRVVIICVCRRCSTVCRRRSAASRTHELLERVGLTEAADRKVGGYSGGMKRRLDLALALVHRPRILFLDEPTTGLDPQSRTALWEEVARLARDDGVTVFLTTQYLEEADVLADRVGIIDHGRIVAEGTPTALKAEIGRPSVHVIPCRPEDRQRLASFLARFGDPLVGDDLAVRLGEGLGLADVVRAMDADGVAVDDIELRAPTLDDVFLAKTGRTLEGACRPEQRVARRPPERPRDADRRGRRPLGAAHAPPARERDPAARLPARADGGERGRTEAVDRAARVSRRTRSSPSRSPCRSSRGRSSPRSTPAPSSRATCRRGS